MTAWLTSTASDTAFLTVLWVVVWKWLFVIMTSASTLAQNSLLGIDVAQTRILESLILLIRTEFYAGLEGPKTLLSRGL